MLIFAHDKRIEVFDLNGEVKATLELGFEVRLLKADGPTEVGSMKSSSG